MFKAQLDWRGSRGYSAYQAEESGNNKVEYSDGTTGKSIPVQITVTAFRPIASDSGDKFDDWLRTRIYILGPVANSYDTDKVCMPTEAKQLDIDVPYDAIQLLSVVAGNTGAVIDLTDEGQKVITDSFNNKTGIFVEDQKVSAVVDPTKTLVENGRLCNIVSPKAHIF